MRTGQGIAAVLARAAGQGLLTRAHQSLAEPERQALLADSGGSMEQQRTRKYVAANGIVEALAERFVAVNGEQGHGFKLSGGSHRRPLAHGAENQKGDDGRRISEKCGHRTRTSDVWSEIRLFPTSAN